MDWRKRVDELRAQETPSGKPMGLWTLRDKLRDEGYTVGANTLRRYLGIGKHGQQAQGREESPADDLMELLIRRREHGVSLQEITEYPEDSLPQLEARGMVLAFRGGRVALERIPEAKVTEAPVEGVFDPSRKVHRFAVISDSHIGGYQAQPAFIRAIFQEAERRGCAAVLHCGDHMDGSPRMHAGFTYELGLHSVDQQVDFTAALYRESQVPILAITGNHDGSWFKDCGIDVGRLMEERCDNFTHIGPIEGWIAGPGGDPNFIRLFHPGDGSSYALSYKDQKTAEYLALSNGKSPSGFHLTGHYHKQNQMRGPNGARYLLVPSSCGITAFMRAKRLINMAGAYFIEFTIDKAGNVDRCIVEDVILWPDQWTRADYSKRPKAARIEARPSNVWR